MAGKDETDAVPRWRRVAGNHRVIGGVEPAADIDADSVTVKLTLAPLE